MYEIIYKVLHIDGVGYKPAKSNCYIYGFSMMRISSLDHNVIVFMKSNRLDLSLSFFEDTR